MTERKLKDSRSPATRNLRGKDFGLFFIRSLTRQQAAGNALGVPFKQALWQIPLLVIAATLLSLGVNHWRSDGIALIGDWSVDARFADAEGDSLVISLEEAEALFERGAALFVDARPPNQYAEGHIHGAVNVPWQEADQYFLETADRLESAEEIVTYCDGEYCELSHDLALFLQRMGFEKVRVLVNGWTAWQEAGLPVQMEE